MQISTDAACMTTEMQISADDASKLIEQAQQGNEQGCEKLQQFKQSKVVAALNLKITTEEAAAQMTKARDGDTEAHRAIKRDVASEARRTASCSPSRHVDWSQDSQNARCELLY